MSLPKQIKSVRCWMSKRSGKSLTDIGYNITLDSNLRAYRDYHIRTINRNFYCDRNKQELIRGSTESISKDSLSDSEDSSTEVMERQYLHGIKELKNYKQSNTSIPEHDGLQSEISWTHHVTGNQNLEKGLKNKLSSVASDVSTDIQVYEGYYYGCKHWNFFCVDDDIGAVIVSLKVELLHGKEYIR